MIINYKPYPGLLEATSDQPHPIAQNTAQLYHVVPHGCIYLHRMSHLSHVAWGCGLRLDHALLLLWCQLFGHALRLASELRPGRVNEE